MPIDIPKTDDRFASEKAGLDVVKPSPEISGGLQFHQHNGTDGSPKIDYKNIQNNEAGGKYLSTVRKTDQFTSASTSFVNVTDLTITITTKNTRVLLLFNSDAYHTVTGGNIYLTFTIDGTAVGGSSGLGTLQFVHGAQNLMMYASIHYVTDVLTAGSHTFKVQMKTSGADGYINFSNTSAIFSSIELST